MELIYKIALIYMILDILVSLYIMIKYREDLKMRLYRFLNPTLPASDFCCEDEFEDMGSAPLSDEERDMFENLLEEESEEIKPKMKQAMDKEFNLK